MKVDSIYWQQHYSGSSYLHFGERMTNFIVVAVQINGTHMRRALGWREDDNVWLVSTASPKRSAVSIANPGHRPDARWLEEKMQIGPVEAEILAELIGDGFLLETREL